MVFFRIVGRKPATRVSAVRRGMFIVQKQPRIAAPLGATHAAPPGLVSIVATEAYNHFAPLALPTPSDVGRGEVEAIEGLRF